MSYLGKILEEGARILCILLFSVMFGSFLLQIFMRYGLDNPLGWTEEVSVILFIWVVFLGNAFLMPENEQISFNVIYLMLSPRGRRVAAVTTRSFFVCLFIVALPFIVEYVNFVSFHRTAILRIPLSLLHLCLVIFIGAYCVRASTTIVRLLGKNWQKVV